jgi:hypothetical protein
MDGITLLTPTGDRQAAFTLAERWMERQTFRGDIQWLVADDGAIPTRCTMGQTVIRPAPLWRPGQNTQFRNLLELLPLIRFDRILHCEDDDWYARTYIETMARRLEQSPLVGEYPARYYNVRYRHWRDCGNDAHASLFQTGMRREMVERLQRICQRRRWIDMALWRATPSQLFRGEESVGIKGMPGRAGQVKAHGRLRPGMDTADPDLEKLRMWIGEDAEVYRGYSA